jgi:hypothetical protein
MILRQLDTERKFCQQIELSALQEVISTQTIRTVLEECGKKAKRERKLCAEAIVWVLIAMNLFSHLSLGMVLEKIAYGLRLLWPGSEEVLPGESALTYRRYQLGVRPLVALFRQICIPMANSDTPGAFAFGLRLMALDGHVTNLPDTPEIAAYFGRPKTGRGEAAWPQVQGVYLSECGTHAVVDVGFWPIQTSERATAKRLLRSVAEGMLLMWDRGLHSYAHIAAALARGAQVLVRLPAHVKPRLLGRLEDGSWLVWLEPPDKEDRANGEGLLLRMIVYTLTDPHRPGFAETHRLLTSLLDHNTAPGEELACVYHQRWEEELTFDEIEIHQQRPDTLLRSRKPMGVLQELYALLLAHYAVRFLMFQAAKKAQIAPNRLSFTRSLEVIEMATSVICLVAPEEIASFYERLLYDLARKPLPERRLRTNPRVVKRKMSNFNVKRAGMQPSPSRLKPFAETVLLI